MQSKPLRFRRDFQVEVLRGEGVLLLSDERHLHLSGHIYELLAPLLTGQYTEDQIIDKLEKKAPLTDVYFALEVLKKNGYLDEADLRVSESVAAFWTSLGIDSPIHKDLSRCVRLQVLGRIDQKEFLSAFRLVGIKQKPSGFPVIITDDYLRPQLKKSNAKMLREKQPWMIVKPVGNTIWLGPIFAPFKTGCWQCLAQRLSANRKVQGFIQRKKGRFIPSSKGSTPATRNIAASLASTEILRWIVEQKNERLEGKIVTLNFSSLETRHHELIRRPQCPACGDPLYSRKKIVPIVLQSRPVEMGNGLHRSISVEETIRNSRVHISPITGVVTHLIRRTPANSPNAVYIAGHNHAMSANNLEMLKNGLRSKSSGKGKTDQDAQASAICEAIERYSGNFAGEEPRIRASYAELAKKAIHPGCLMLFSNHQYRNRKQWNARRFRFQFVPEPFPRDRKVEWTPVFSLTDLTWKYVPTAYCYYGYDQKLKETFSLADSNGNASGNTMEEAILQGFLELVERDSVAIWWYNRLTRPGVDLLSFQEPYYCELKEFYASKNRELWVLDLTTDLNIPSFAAITRKTGQGAQEIAFGFGAHFDAKLAVLRAVTEMGQLLPYFDLPKNTATEYNFDDPVAIEWWRTATTEEHSYLLPDPKAKMMSYSLYPKYGTTDLREDVLHCVEIARNHGMETLVLDQTRPDIRMPVVKVMVPGLRHFWARFAPGRLYDVPVRQGWLKRPKRESQLNPIPLFV